ncbi:FkbM family methyltransferase [Methylobacterium aquaticum]|uniref:FkbM family methyltransferase n=1 Tax=Methylobacterium aquaticum TaxID=270351 RepID=UPI001931BAD9|nr:FkbM family methyltransferase [Methylobacterium aquaticum]QRE77262.1 FkbM family methyltransferase [Methylobacterium aquaticum]
MSVHEILKVCHSLRSNFSTSSLYNSREREFVAYVVQNAHLSSSQLFQDLWVLFNTREKKDGYFVEFGACDGEKLSNTILLEKIFGWDGAVAEPCKEWHDKLYNSRSCYISSKCIFSQTGHILEFNQTSDPALSTLETFTSCDHHATLRESGLRYPVETITLEDFLIEAKSPKIIDYMSIDTEGSEIDILLSFDFSKYDIGLISIEHNYTKQRREIFDLLSKNGYRRVFANFSDFDDWYIKTK